MWFRRPCARQYHWLKSNRIVYRMGTNHRCRNLWFLKFDFSKIQMPGYLVPRFSNPRIFSNLPRNIPYPKRSIFYKKCSYNTMTVQADIDGGNFLIWFWSKNYSVTLALSKISKFLLVRVLFSICGRIYQSWAFIILFSKLGFGKIFASHFRDWCIWA